jgi:hypothetical protein
MTDQTSRILCDKCHDIDLYGLLGPFSNLKPISETRSAPPPESAAGARRNVRQWHKTLAEVQHPGYYCQLCRLILQGWYESRELASADEEPRLGLGKVVWRRQQVAAELSNSDARSPDVTSYPEKTIVSWELVRKPVIGFALQGSRSDYWTRTIRFICRPDSSRTWPQKLASEALVSEFRIAVRKAQHDEFGEEAILDRDGYRLDMALNPDPRSPQSLSVARGWLRTCIKQHGDRCNSPGTPARAERREATASHPDSGGSADAGSQNAMPVRPDPNILTSKATPSRLLEVTADGATVHLRMTQALLSSTGQTPPYVALSHCWGKSRSPLTTTRTTLDRRRQGIKTASMPQTFQDAVAVVIALGLRYIWIDSLCIIQDDADDWAIESSAMAAIYRQAHLVLAATRCKADRNGFLGLRESWTTVGIPHPVPNPGADEPPADAVLELSLLPREHRTWRSGVDPMADEPLNDRAWCLQERSLARRTLHYATHAMYWECQSARATELGVSDTFPEPHQSSHLSSIWQTSNSSSSVFSRPIRTPTLEQQGVNDLGWYTMLEDYTRRSITKDTDRLPALSGLSRLAQDARSDAYLAGIWQSSLLEGLMWCSVSPLKMLRLPPADASYIAPSWSWASVIGPVSFPMYTWYSNRAPWVGQMADFEPLASYATHNLEPAGPDRHGKLVWGGQLELDIVLPLATVVSIAPRLQGPRTADKTEESSVRSLLWKRRGAEPEPRRSDYTSRLFTLQDSSPSMKKGKATYMHIEGDLDLAEPPAVVTARQMVVVFLTRLPHVEGKTFREHRFGLILEELGTRRGFYRRVGFVDGFLMEKAWDGAFKPVKFRCSKGDADGVAHTDNTNRYAPSPAKPAPGRILLV